MRVVLQSPPQIGIGGGPIPKTDEIVLRIDPDPGACFLIEAKQPGQEALRRVHLDLLFKQQFGDQPGPYERLLADALAGNQQRFAREDRCMRDLADRAAPARQPLPARVLPAGDLGPGGSLEPAARVRRLAQALASG